jgi:S-adenosylmethionine/arginine decarboxylase-like enzyme
MKPQRLAVVPATTPLSIPDGCGSTNVFFDLYFKSVTKHMAAFCPEKLDRLIRNAIAGSGMQRRTGVLDVWETKEFGPATSFHSLQESHVRVETWPKEGHVQGEVQLCNFSRDNSAAARRLADTIIQSLQPTTVEIIVLIRGPGKKITFCKE